MPKRLTSILRRRLSRITNILQILGVLGLVSIALTSSEITDLPTLANHFQNFESIKKFLLSHTKALILIGITLNGYRLYKLNVENELELIGSAFQDGISPLTYNSLIGHKYIQLIGFALMIAFISLILSATNIIVFCEITLFLQVVDIIGNTVTIENIRKAFDEFVIPDDSGYYLRNRREIVADYYFLNPHVVKCARSMFFTLAALSFVLHGENIEGIWTFTPYALLALGHAQNEYSMWKWRRRRDSKLEILAKKEETARMNAKRTAM